MMKIAVLSDTHGLLRPEVIKVIGECDAVLHAGDINSQKIVDQMKEAAGKHAPSILSEAIMTKSGRSICRII